MSDEMFRLTPVDVRRMEFPRAVRGYDKARVDDFREQIAEELDRLGRANQELDAKVKSLTEQLKLFRERDRALNEALVSAQQLRSEVREQSERESSLIIREARGEADRIVQGARVDAMRIAEQIAALARMRRGYIKQFRVMLERQLAEIAVEEDVPDPDTSPIIGAEGTGAAPAAAAPTPAPATPPPPAAVPSPRSGALFRG